MFPTTTCGFKRTSWRMGSNHDETCIVSPSHYFKLSLIVQRIRREEAFRFISQVPGQYP